MNRQRHASRMLWVSPPNQPSSVTVPSIDGRIARTTGGSSGASSRP